MADQATNKNTAQNPGANQRNEVIAEGEQNLPEVDITAQNFDAEQMQESYVEGEQKAPT
ncbi:MAG: hypothetical protein HC866_07840, partial [Leptolyngbyaceae cyanobacterium RU_5_1]|nr:hypothetical protein [Leptolyngbyaceae cyanobacterium RU_5_1]